MRSGSEQAEAWQLRRCRGKIVPDDALQIAEHQSFQRQVWQAQRLGWVALALMLGMAALGLTGDGGPFARQVLVAGTVSADVPRVSRIGADEQITNAAPAVGGSVNLHLDSAFLRAFEIGAIQPAPARQEVRADGLALTIAAQGGGLLDIALSVRARTLGWRGYAITVNGRRIAASTLVLP